MQDTGIFIPIHLSFLRKIICLTDVHSLEKFHFIQPLSLNQMLKYVRKDQKNLSPIGCFLLPGFSWRCHLFYSACNRILDGSIGFFKSLCLAGIFGLQTPGVSENVILL